MFKGWRIDIQQLRQSILRRYSESVTAMEEEAKSETFTHTVFPSRRICDTAKVFTVSDASWKEGRAGIAVGLLDIRNNKTEWFAKQASATSATEAEMLAIKWAMQLARERGFNKFAGASDAKILVDALKKHISEAFTGIGQTEFYYSEIPKSMSSIATSLFGLVNNLMVIGALAQCFCAEVELQQDIS
ncbi:hypothetical protein G4B88_012059 [Cannabis sativa]|uniref:RNase H type-1 domain-containing protein n=1 Tax=Cannabis sativa TaxID=3483 RepID=A0A7J6ETL4_CANSA|nr:hypothetical protein G4B88_012059 [Cannabis sativa]